MRDVLPATPSRMGKREVSSRPRKNSSPISVGHATPTFLDFFAGAGLVRLGLEPLWSCSWANDIDPKKQQVYETWFGSQEFVLGDVGGISADSLPKGVDMAWASFPCQDLSLAGSRRGMNAERSGTFWEFSRLMRDSLEQGERPPLIVIENVVGLLSGEDFPNLCQAIASLGMQFGPLVIDARHFLPQSRPRVFVVAVDSRIDCSGFTRERVPDSGPWFTKAVKAAHEQISASLRERWRWWALPEPYASPIPMERIVEDDPAEVEWHAPEETERLLGMMTTLNLEKTHRAVERGPAVGFLYKRMRGGVQRAEVRFDGIAGCLRTPRGGSSRQIVLFVNNGRIRSRLISPREAARLMGVPDLFRLPARYNDAYRAIGDGVAVPVVQWLSEQLLIPLAKLCDDIGTSVRGKDSSAAGQRSMAGPSSIEQPPMSGSAISS